MLLQQVRDTVTPKTPDQIRWLCNMVILAAHDRRVTREFFIEVVNCVAEIQVSLADLISGGRMRYLMSTLDDERETPLINEEMQKTMQGLMRQREKLESMLVKITQCPTLEDTVS